MRSGVGARMISEEGNQDDLGIRLECDESGCVFVIGQNVPSLEEDSKGYLQCDLSGEKNLFSTIVGQCFCSCQYGLVEHVWLS